MSDLPPDVLAWALAHEHPRYREWLTEDHPNRAKRLAHLITLARGGVPCLEPVEYRRGKPVVPKGHRH